MYCNIDTLFDYRLIISECFFSFRIFALTDLAPASNPIYCLYFFKFNIFNIIYISNINRFLTYIYYKSLSDALPFCFAIKPYKIPFFYYFLLKYLLFYRKILANLQIIFTIEVDYM